MAVFDWRMLVAASKNTIEAWKGNH